MSKTLNTIQELWSYCLYCMVCNNSCREMTVSAGPNDQFVLIHFDKKDNTLNIQCIYKKKYYITYEINCLNNTFDIISNNSDVVNTYCYFYIQSVCRKCNETHVLGTDIELNLKEKTTNNIGLEKEGIYLLSTKDMYHITMLYKSSTMLVSKCFKDENGVVLDDNRICTLPLVDLDFSNLHKAAYRIKTMLVFS